MVTGLQQHAHRDIDPFLGTGETEHIGSLALLVSGGDGIAQRRFAICLGVAEPQRFEGDAIVWFGQFQQGRQGHALCIRCGQVVARAEFPARKVGFQAEVG
jgi:hypothetical protein